MHPRSLTSLLVAAAIVTACGTTPNPNLDNARAEVDRIKGDPLVTELAPQELNQAQELLGQAEKAHKEDEDDASVNHLAYLTAQAAQIAAERAKQKDAERQIETSTAERDRVRLEARTTEADRAKAMAAQSQQQAKAALAQASAAEASSMDAQQRAAALEAELKSLNAKQTDRGTVVTLGDVLFDSGKATLKPGSRRNLEKLADALKSASNRKIVIEGHTDSKGGDAFNQELSENRAEAVHRALVDLGVPSDQVKTEGYGEQYPVANNKTASGRQLNRRVEIIISNDAQDVAPRSRTE